MLAPQYSSRVYQGLKSAVEYEVFNHSGFSRDCQGFKSTVKCGFLHNVGPKVALQSLPRWQKFGKMYAPRERGPERVIHGL